MHFYPQLDDYYVDRARAWVKETQRSWAENPPPPRQPVHFTTEEEHLAQMVERLAEIEELMRGRLHNPQSEPVAVAG